MTRLPTAALLALLAGTAALPAQAATAWTVDAANSKLEWVADWSGAALKGRFTAFTATIAFDPADLATSSIAVEIPVASAKSSAAEVNEALPEPDWFSAAAFPTARFASTSIRAGEGAGNYIATGTLTIRDRSQPLELPFTVKIDGSAAEATGTVTLQRTAFGVGQGEWESTDEIADDVAVSFTVKATSQE